MRRDKHTCRKCGYKPTDERLEVHHIVPQAFGGNDSVDNLATLCSTCHRYAPDDRLPKGAYSRVFTGYESTGRRPEVDLFKFGTRVSDAGDVYPEGVKPRAPSDYWLFHALYVGYDPIAEVVDVDELVPPATERAVNDVDERLENGYDHGRPPFGLRFDDEGKYWVPDTNEFEQALECIRLRDKGSSWRGVEDKTGVDKNTARRVYERKEKYLKHKEPA